MSSNRIEQVAPMLAEAEAFLAPLSADEKGSVVAEIASIRALLAAMLLPDEERKLTAAKGKVRQARTQLDAGYRAAEIEQSLAQAEAYLAEIPVAKASHTTQVTTDIAAVRAAIAPTGAVVAPSSAATATTPAVQPAVAAPVQPAVAPPQPAVAAPVQPAVVPPPPAAAPVQAAAGVEAAADAATQAVRTAERDVMFESSFDLAKYAPHGAAASQAIAALVQLAPDHASLPDLMRRLGEVTAKADKLATDAFRHTFDSAKRSAERDANQLAEARASGRRPKDLDPAHTAKQLATWIERVQPAVAAARSQLTGERGMAAIAEADGWIAATQAQIADLALVAEAFEQFRATVEVDGFGTTELPNALQSAEHNLSRDPRRAMLGWDAAKKLFPRFAQPRFAAVPEVAALVERYRAFEQRVASELRPLIAKIETAPLIASAKSSLDLVQRDLDNRDEERLLEWRGKLRAALAPLERDWADVPDVQDFLAKCARTMARCDEDLPQLALREIQAVEAVVKPLVERVERAIDLASASRALDHAPRLRARRAALAPFLAHQRAALLDGRAGAALARIAEVLGADVARAVDDAEEVPQLDIDLASDTKVQSLLADFNRAFASYRAEREKAQVEFDADVDPHGSGAKPHVFRTIESAVSTMTRALRGLDDKVDELRRIDRAHPAIAIVEEAVPRLVRRATAWKERLGKRIEYAGAIYAAHHPLDNARRTAALTTGEPHADATHWPEVLDNLARVDPEVARAIAILPDDHDEADAVAAEVAALRAEAIAKLSAQCLAAATRHATDGHTDQARRFADVLAKAVPDAPENAQIAAAIAGTADARQKAQVEIARRGALIRERASEAARAARPHYDAWAAGKEAVVALAGTILEQLDRYTGKWIAVHARSLGVFIHDEPGEHGGDIYQVDYDPAVREHLLAGMKRLDAMYAQMAEKVMTEHGIGGLSTREQHYPRDAHYLCEIVGSARYTPRREVRDNYGRLVGTIDGVPYPVPRVVIRGVASDYFVVVPGHPPSLDAMDASGIVD